MPVGGSIGLGITFKFECPRMGVVYQQFRIWMTIPVRNQNFYLYGAFHTHVTLLPHQPWDHFTTPAKSHKYKPEFNSMTARLVMILHDHILEFPLFFHSPISLNPNPISPFGRSSSYNWIQNLYIYIIILNRQFSSISQLPGPKNHMNH